MESSSYISIYRKWYKRLFLISLIFLVFPVIAYLASSIEWGADGSQDISGWALLSVMFWAGPFLLLTFLATVINFFVMSFWLVFGYIKPAEVKLFEFLVYGVSLLMVTIFIVLVLSW